MPNWKNNSLHLTEENRFTVEGSFVDDSMLVSAVASDTLFGGLYFVKRSGWIGGAEVWCVDRLSSRGVDANSDLVIRSLPNEGFMLLTTYNTTAAKTLISDKGKNVHDVRILDGKIYAVSTGTNEVLCLDGDGGITKTWTFPGGRDAWHINGIDLWDGRLVACAFGRFDKDAGHEGKTKDAGIIFDLETQKDVVTGLTGPHTPRSDKKGNKYVCDSGNKRLLIKQSSGGDKWIDFKDAFPRGVAFGREAIYVGLNYLTADEDSASVSKIAILDASTLEQTGAIELDVPEIYDIVVVDV